MGTIRILSWNVNGIRAVHKKGFLDWIAVERPGILCIQETKASEDQLPEELKDIDGYRSWFVSAEKKGYSGVALYSAIEPLSVEAGFGIGRFDSEGRVIVARYDDFLLYNVYFPNGKASEERLRYKMDFYEAFLGHIEAVRAKGNNVVICGDVNTAHREIDLARPKENETESGFLPEERAWIDRFLAHGYVDTFRRFHDEPDQYSWWTYRGGARSRNIGWRIDYFYVNEEFAGRVRDAFIMPDVEGSDHCPVGIEIES